MAGEKKVEKGFFGLRVGIYSEVLIESRLKILAMFEVNVETTD